MFDQTPAFYVQDTLTAKVYRLLTVTRYTRTIAGFFTILYLAETY